MNLDASRYRVKLAETDAERAGAQRLRYRVFVEEMGAEATPEEHALRREWDDFDPWFDHLILESLDPARRRPPRPRRRRLPADARRGRPRRPGLLRRRRVRPRADPREPAARAVELGRSCVAPEHRGGAGDAPLVERPRRVRPRPRHRAHVRGRELPRHRPRARSPRRSPSSTTATSRPPDLRVRARPSTTSRWTGCRPRRSTPARALQAIPPLIKAYLRLGGFVGEGAYVDRAFNTIDVCVVMDTGRMTARYARLLRSAGATARGLRAGWNGAEPAGPAAARPAASACASPSAPPGPPLALAVLFALFLPLRGLDLLLERLAGRPVTALGPGIVRLWAAQALPTLGLRFVTPGHADARRRRLRRQPFELDRHRRPPARRRPVPRLQGRGPRLARHRPHRPRHRHDVHRPPPGRGQAPGGGAPRPARPRRPHGDLPRGHELRRPAHPAVQVVALRRLPRARPRRRHRRPAGDDRLSPAPRPAGELLRLVGRDGLREPPPRRPRPLDRRHRHAHLPPAARRSPTTPTARPSPAPPRPRSAPPSLRRPPSARPRLSYGLETWRAVVFRQQAERQQRKRCAHLRALLRGNGRVPHASARATPGPRRGGVQPRGGGGSMPPFAAPRLSHALDEGRERRRRILARAQISAPIATKSATGASAPTSSGVSAALGDAGHLDHLRPPGEELELGDAAVAEPARRPPARRRRSPRRSPPPSCPRAARPAR